MRLDKIAAKLDVLATRIVEQAFVPGIDEVLSSDLVVEARIAVQLADRLRALRLRVYEG